MAEIKILPPEIARTIAAGEVIDRPASILRELLDNAVDAGADSIEVHLKDGGLGEITVTDNGCGMDRENLKRSILPHATSKIETAEDMHRIATLGFRGEALASVAACARLTILTRSAESDKAYRLTANGIEEPLLETAAGPPGTAVTVREIFYNIPARKKFLSSPTGESTACLNIFTEKAAGHPHIAFRLFQNGKMRLFYPAADLKGRTAAVLAGSLPQDALLSGEREFDRFKISVIAADPGFYRKDKKGIRIFLNKRQIAEYAFVQAVEFGFKEFMQSVCFPYCFVFIEIDPAFVDFNIHPAKKEVRIANKDDVHRAIVLTVKETVGKNRTGAPLRQKTETHTVSLFDEPFTETKEKPLFRTSLLTHPVIREKTPELIRSIQATEPARSFEYRRAKNDKKSMPAFKPVLEAVSETAEISTAAETSVPYRSDETDDFIYRGQIFNLFLLAERGDEFYIIDQHAAHERILFESFRTLPPVRQPLLVPLKLEIDEPQKITAMIESLKTLGIEIENRGDNELFLISLGAFWNGNEHLIAEELNRPFTSLFELEKRLTAARACKSAVKDGDLLSEATAKEIIRGAFRLENPHCPHGRPIWFRLTRTELFKLVGRLV